ncbi:MAG: hypothetical protein PHT07_12285 [Paludibacter sp.]|nr:hypothetical protein [Paludibacter sp.]
MKNIKGVFFILLTFSLLISCDSRQKQEKLADARLKVIEKLISQNSLNAAKIQIDSIHFLFPRLVNKRRIAAALEDTIVRRESSRTLAYCDSILPKKQHEFDSIQKNFRFEKDKIYQETGNFVYKTQQTESNANRIYLKTYVSENADLFLISNYCGGKLEHTTVEVTSADLFAHTDTIDTSDPNYHSFTDGGQRWEVVTFKNDAGKDVASFIAQYSKQQIKVILHGKKNYVYYLDDSDKKAILETYHLWVVKKDVVKLQKEIKKATSKIERIKNSGK